MGKSLESHSQHRLAFMVLEGLSMSLDGALLHTFLVLHSLLAVPFHHQATPRHASCLLHELSEVTVDEVVNLIRSMPAKSSPVDFMPTTMLKSTVGIMAPLIT